MKEFNKNTLVLFIVIITFIIIVSGTYAYWQITRTQKNDNDIVAACLSLDLQDKSPAIDLESAWPISDEEASSLTGYTFTVTNNCDEEINYIVGLNRVEESNYLQDSSIRLRLDENLFYDYSELSDLKYVDSTNSHVSRISKQVSTETIDANEVKEHTIRIWVSNNAPVSEQSKIFKGQIFITGGQGIDVKECFLIDHDGRIAGYNENCGSIVKLPPEINGVKVKKIDIDSFKTNHALGIQAIKGKQQKLYVVYIDDTNKEMLDSAMLNDVCQTLGVCGISNVGDIATILSFEEFALHDWNQYDEVSRVRYNLVYETGKFRDRSKLIVTTLDLSQTKYLETIGDYAFTSNYESDTKDGEFCVENYNTGKKYICYGVLQKLLLPQNGMLSEIGGRAFAFNQLTEVVIPSSVKTIGDYAFGENLKLKKIVVKNLEENVNTTYYSFPPSATVIYDPNYSE